MKFTLHKADIEGCLILLKRAATQSTFQDATLFVMEIFPDKRQLRIQFQADTNEYEYVSYTTADLGPQQLYFAISKKEFVSVFKSQAIPETVVFNYDDSKSALHFKISNITYRLDMVAWSSPTYTRLMETGDTVLNVSAGVIQNILKRSSSCRASNNYRALDGIHLVYKQAWLMSEACNEFAYVTIFSNVFANQEGKNVPDIVLSAIAIDDLTAILPFVGGEASVTIQSLRDGKSLLLQVDDNSTTYKIATPKYEHEYPNTQSFAKRPSTVKLGVIEIKELRQSVSILTDVLKASRIQMDFEGGEVKLSKHITSTEISNSPYVNAEAALPLNHHGEGKHTYIVRVDNLLAVMPWFTNTHCMLTADQDARLLKFVDIINEAPDETHGVAIVGLTQEVPQ